MQRQFRLARSLFFPAAQVTAPEARPPSVRDDICAFNGFLNDTRNPVPKLEAALASDAIGAIR